MAPENRKQNRLSRRDFIKGAAVGAAVAAGGTVLGNANPPAATAASTVTVLSNAGTQAGKGPSTCDGSQDLALINGKFLTMDDNDSVVSAVAIRNGRIAEVGRHAQAIGPCAQTINLRGATVIPGLIESCDHIVSFSNYRPGYHTVLENATSIAEIQEILAARRADVPPGEWITSLGTWTAETMFAERRLPTRAELDAAVSDRPVLLFQTSSGPSATNSLGKAYFENASIPVTVSADGFITSGIQSTTALYLLRLTQTLEQKRRTHLEAWAYTASVGLTSHIDQEGTPSPPAPHYELGSSTLSGPSLTPDQALMNFDHFRHWDTWWGLHREGKTQVRLQADLVVDEIPILNERIKNQLPFFGDDMMSTHAVYFTPAGQVNNPTWFEAQRLMARAGWRSRSNPGNQAGVETAITAFEQINQEFDITGLRWTLHRMSGVTHDQLNRLKALGGTVNIVSRSYPLAAAQAPAAPFRTVVDNGIHAGIHMDGGHIAPLNPWITIYFAVTGRNGLGELVNPGQQITRQEALRLFTRGNAYQMHMEDKLGSIEVGKLADLVVLDNDPFTVSDEGLKKIRSVLTVVGGKIVHGGELIRRRHETH
jgi:predicted amidohydrolase YtcJ